MPLPRYDSVKSHARKARRRARDQRSKREPIDAVDGIAVRSLPRAPAAFYAIARANAFTTFQRSPCARREKKTLPAYVRTAGHPWRKASLTLVPLSPPLSRTRRGGVLHFIRTEAKHAQNVIG
ncbi:hypothetical protein X777_15971 [Ooceraea biroi]|uniref:Uncharacterized protein n=1 Tax=Ooceraea biroi TaxID=2015173 RepID=A0A026WUH8_OOCBI|nr:hypothetical protein X777_15971 [Ooceraea biroi]